MRIHAWVRGRVQGVFFRFNTKLRAEALGLVGWVRNLPDGRVELVAEGDKLRLEQLVAFCHQGPEFAHVDEVEVDWGPPTGEFERFSVRR